MGILSTAFILLSGTAIRLHSEKFFCDNSPSVGPRGSTTPPFLEKLEYIEQKFLLQKKFLVRTILYSKSQHSIAKIATLVLSGLNYPYTNFGAFIKKCKIQPKMAAYPLYYNNYMYT